MKPGSRLTVLYFSNEPVRGGAEEHMLMLLNRLDRRRFRTILAAPPKLIKLLRMDLAPDVATIPITLRSPSHLASSWRFLRLLKSHDVDIAHSHMFQASRFASPLAWCAGVPAVIETPHVREHWRTGWLKGSFLVDRLVARCVDAFIAVSKANEQYLLTEKGLAGQKIHVIQNGTRVERFKCSKDDAEFLRNSLGIDPAIPIVAVLARLEPQKGHAVLLDAWKTVRASWDAHLVLIGEGSLRQQLEDQVASLGILNSVTFAGYQSNVEKWLALSEFTVLPSFYEGLPLAAIESLAARRPVVATTVDGTPEVVIDGETGFAVPPGEPRPLAAAICKLLANPEMVREFGNAGHKLVTQTFNQDRQVKETEDLYLRIWREKIGRDDPALVRAELASPVSIFDHRMESHGTHS